MVFRLYKRTAHKSVGKWNGCDVRVRDHETLKLVTRKFTFCACPAAGYASVDLDQRTYAYTERGRCMRQLRVQLKDEDPLGAF